MVARGLRSGEGLTSEGHRAIYGDGNVLCLDCGIITGLHMFVKTHTLKRAIFIVHKIISQ